MAKVLIIYETRNGKTRIISDFIADEIKAAGIEVDIKNIGSFQSYDDLKYYDAFIFGSATVVGSMMPGMKEFLINLEKKELKGKIGGAFGTFGCCGKGPILIYTEMKKKLGMNMVSEPLLLESEFPTEIMKMGRKYGREIVKKFKCIDY